VALVGDGGEGGAALEVDAGPGGLRRQLDDLVEVGQLVDFAVLGLVDLEVVLLLLAGLLDRRAQLGRVELALDDEVRLVPLVLVGRDDDALDVLEGVEAQLLERLLGVLAGQYLVEADLLDQLRAGTSRSRGRRPRRGPGRRRPAGPRPGSAPRPPGCACGTTT
jgi:hypothetical protein